MRIRVLLAAAIALAPLTLPAQQTTLPLWPHSLPSPPRTSDPETDHTKPTDNLINGHRTARLTNVTHPTLTVYAPARNNTGVAALVFPGGGYSILAYNGEGTDVCEWLNSIGVTCLLVKYRVPQPAAAAGHYPADPDDLEDAQQAMRLAREHAAEWHFSRDHIGVIGFSAGANLAVLLCTHPDDTHILATPAAPDVPTINGTPRDANPNFAIIVYPAYLAVPPAETQLDPVYTPNKFTPPTFLIQAENDKSYGRNALVYYRALMDANIPAELHYFATGGHGFGIRPPNQPEEHWTDLAANWLHFYGLIPKVTQPRASGSVIPIGTTQPCTVDLQPPTAGAPRPNPNPNATDNPCP